MGSSKVGKTSFVKKLLGINDSAKASENKIDTIYEYREHRLEPDVISGSTEPPMRYRAIEKGQLFVVLFSVNDIETFNHASELRDSIVEKKGKDVPILFIGLKSEKSRMTRSISFEFADLVVSCDLECKYYDVALSDDTALETIHQEILSHQQKHYAHMSTQLKRRGLNIRRVLLRLLSCE